MPIGVAQPDNLNSVMFIEGLGDDMKGDLASIPGAV